MAKSLLHVGCGSDVLPEWASGFVETRLDVCPDYSPHIVANMTAMGEIGEYDAVLCSHALEHLPPHEVGTALSEFLRVLRAGGHAIVFVPDLEGVTPTEETLFVSPAGPISGIDLMYGYRPSLAEFPYMAHRTGFVQDTLHKAIKDAGFSKVETKRLSNYALMGVGVK
jgi:ubiquinone/menaquinone biosynthesis C-methylase UbiE